MSAIVKNIKVGRTGIVGEVVLGTDSLGSMVTTTVRITSTTEEAQRALKPLEDLLWEKARTRVAEATKGS